MTTTQIVVLVSWVIGGFFVALALAIAESRSGTKDSPGLLLLAMWILAPVVVFFALLAGLVLLLGHTVEKADAKLPLTKTQMRARIAQLEKELDEEEV